MDATITGTLDILPENLKTGKVPKVDSEIGAADDVATIELQVRLQADTAVFRHCQCLQTPTVDLPP